MGGGNSRRNPLACPQSSGLLAPCPCQSRRDFPQDGSRRRLRLVLYRPPRAGSGLLAEAACLTGKLKAQIERCRPAFFAAAPDVGRQDPDPRPCTVAGDDPPSAPVGFESAAGRIRPGGILQAPDVLQSESNRQRSLGQTKICRAKTSNCPRACYSADGPALGLFSDTQRQSQVSAAIRFGGADPPSIFPKSMNGNS